MKNTEKGILISAIIGRLEEQNKKRNADLCKQNLFSDQKAFDRGAMFFTLAFMADDEFNKIAAMVI
jgi:hypothetical protein